MTVSDYTLAVIVNLCHDEQLIIIVLCELTAMKLVVMKVMRSPAATHCFAQLSFMAGLLCRSDPFKT